jgi:hypothetical protein
MIQVYFLLFYSLPSPMLGNSYHSFSWLLEHHAPHITGARAYGNMQLLRSASKARKTQKANTLGISLKNPTSPQYNPVIP